MQSCFALHEPHLKNDVLRKESRWNCACARLLAAVSDIFVLPQRPACQLRTFVTFSGISFPPPPFGGFFIITLP